MANLKNDTLIRALKRQPTPYTPVWIMRQAGRYLPEYRKIKEKHSLEDMFRTPELAAEVTCQPVGILGVDAAILFADILTLPAAMGFDISFDNGGQRIHNRIERPSDIENAHDFDDLSHVRETVRLVNDRLAGQVPLIGFAGSPFTVLTYLVEGGSSTNFKRTLSFMEKKEKAFHAFMALLTKNTIAYLALQKEAGVKAFQLFDSWAGILPAAEFARCVLPYVQEVFRAVDLPSIYYVRNSDHLLALMDRSQADFLSVDHTVVLGHHPVIEKTDKGIQGNLFSGHLYADYPRLEKEVKDVLVGGCKHRCYIFNLGSGVFPDVEVDKLKFVVEQVHAFNKTT